MEDLDRAHGYARFCADVRAGRFAGMHLEGGASLFAWRDDKGMVLALRPGSDVAAETSMTSALKRRWRDPFTFAAVRIAADELGVPYALYPMGTIDFEASVLPAAVKLMRRLLA